MPLCEPTYKLVYNEENQFYKKPELPFLVGIGERVYEALSVRDAIAAVVNDATRHDYTEVEFGETAFFLRIQAARQHVMFAAMDDVDAIVWSNKGVGRIRENYAAAEDDPDYADNFKGEPHKIIVDSDPEFLKSLAELGTIVLFVREDFKDKLFSGKLLATGQKCLTCIYNKENVCSVYGNLTGEKYRQAFPNDRNYDAEKDGADCCAYVEKTPDREIKRDNGRYVNCKTGEEVEF